MSVEEEAQRFSCNVLADGLAPIYFEKYGLTLDEVRQIVYETPDGENWIWRVEEAARDLSREKRSQE